MIIGCKLGEEIIKIEINANISFGFNEIVCPEKSDKELSNVRFDSLDMNSNGILQNFFFNLKNAQETNTNKNITVYQYLDDNDEGMLLYQNSANEQIRSISYQAKVDDNTQKIMFSVIILIDDKVS